MYQGVTIDTIFSETSYLRFKFILTFDQRIKQRMMFIMSFRLEAFLMEIEIEQGLFFVLEKK